MAKKLIKTIAILAILALAIYYANTVFTFTDEMDTNKIFEDFYGQPEHSLDGVYFGTSATQRGWLSPIAYNEEGVTVYSLATTSQPFCLTEDLIKEVEKTQSPKLFIVDLRSVIASPDEIADAHIRRVTDNMKESMNRFEAVDTALDFASHGDNDIDVNDKSYYFKLMKYHILWNRSLANPKKAGLEYFQGFAYYEKAYYNVKPLRDCGIITSRKPVDKYTEGSIKSLLDYSDSVKADVLFVVSPCEATEDEVAKYNYASDMARKRGYTVLNFFDKDMRKVIRLDFDTFFYNS